MEKNALLLKTRKKIYEHILSNPGEYLRQIQKKLDMSMGHLEYHLNYLEKNDIIYSRFEENHKRYYPKRVLTVKEREIMSILRQKTMRKIILVLLKRPYSTYS